jgi:intracellular sulfur oxidation DsrE/DsrF family protein
LSAREKSIARTRRALNSLKKHPNYAALEPLDGEDKIAFALRSVSHLISPPQEHGETNEIECIHLADAVLLLREDIEAKWNERKQ